MLIDEVHLLNDSRGSALEAGAVSRIKMVSQFREMEGVSPYQLKLPSHTTITIDASIVLHTCDAIIAQQMHRANSNQSCP